MMISQQNFQFNSREVSQSEPDQYELQSIPQVYVHSEQTFVSTFFQQISKYSICILIAILLALFFISKTIDQNKQNVGNVLSKNVGSTPYSVVHEEINHTTITLTLQYQGTAKYLENSNNQIIKNAIFTFHVQSATDFYFKIIDKEKKRFQIPTDRQPFTKDPLQKQHFSIKESNITFEYKKRPFGFKIVRKATGAILFSTYNSTLLLSDYYLQIGTEIASDFVYGLGERFTNNFRIIDGKWTIFNRDRGGVIDTGVGLQTYGYYPFYLIKEDKHNLFHINYLRSSNAMDVIKTTQGDNNYLSFHVIGGVFDFRFFLGNSNAEQTIKQFHQYIGPAHIPPFWSLGFHQCRWGYKNINYIKKVIENYEKHKIPLDTIWLDIDYMKDYEDFTVDQKKFPLEELSKVAEKYHLVPIIDAGIKMDGETYNEGYKKDVFILDSVGNHFVGKVWPEKAVFVDFFHPKADQFWIDCFQKFNKQINFSGIWLDMNEIANFCDGSCKYFKFIKTGFSYSTDISYHPGMDNIETHTIPLNAVHYGNILEANVHAYFGLMETYATFKYLNKNNTQRPFILSRSSTIGSHRYGFHWTGDNDASWDSLKGSITDCFNNQLWGLQMIGPDICGFGSNTTEQLCSRWFQLSTVYSFARNHNSINGNDQQPYALGDLVLKSAQKNIRLRYSILKQYYSIFIKQNGTGTIFRPLFFQFQGDFMLYEDAVANTQILIGESLMAVPILEKGKNNRDLYFPQSYWFDLYTGKSYQKGISMIQNILITDKLPLFLRSGYSFFMQSTDNVMKTDHLNSEFILYCAFRQLSQSKTEEINISYSRGSIMSIQSFNNNININKCLLLGCFYNLQLILMNKANKQLILEIKTTYQGMELLNEDVLIKEVRIFQENLPPLIKKLNSMINLSEKEKFQIDLT